MRRSHFRTWKIWFTTWFHAPLAQISPPLLRPTKKQKNSRINYCFKGPWTGFITSYRSLFYKLNLYVCQCVCQVLKPWIWRRILIDSDQQIRVTLKPLQNRRQLPIQAPLLLDILDFLRKFFVKLLLSWL